jgi:Tol biopolymer transport system component
MCHYFDLRGFLRSALLVSMLLAVGCSSERSPQQISNPAFFPDGERLIFSYGEWATGRELAVVDLKTEAITFFGRQGFLPEDRDWEAPSVSRDGTKILFVINEKVADAHIAMMDIDGRNVSKLTRGPGYRLAPRFSPDGKKVVYLRGRATGHRWPYDTLDVFELDLETRREARLSNMGLWLDTRVNYLDGGNKVVFSVSDFRPADPPGRPGFWTAYYDQYAGNRIFAVDKNLIGPDSLVPLFQFGRWSRLRDVSADGSVMLFQAAVDHLDPEKKESRPLHNLFIRRGEEISRVSMLGYNSTGALSHDGRRVALVSKRVKTRGYGDETIWVVNADGTGLRELTLNLKSPGR